MSDGLAHVDEIECKGVFFFFFFFLDTWELKWRNKLYDRFRWPEEILSAAHPRWKSIHLFTITYIFSAETEIITFELDVSIIFSASLFCSFNCQLFCFLISAKQLSYCFWTAIETYVKVPPNSKLQIYIKQISDKVAQLKHKELNKRTEKLLSLFMHADANETLVQECLIFKRCNRIRNFVIVKIIKMTRNNL